MFKHQHGSCEFASCREKLTYFSVTVPDVCGAFRDVRACHFVRFQEQVLRRMDSMKHLLQILVLLLSGLPMVSAQQAAPVRIVETYWGFDGRVTEGEFQPFSLLLDNRSDQPVEGTVSIQKVSGLIRTVGARHEVPVFLGPASRRWVQFYPLISGNLNTWEVRLQTESGLFDLGSKDQPGLVEAERLLKGNEEIRLVTVLLVPAESLQRVPTSIRHMPDDVFPPYSTATHGLHALYMDHVPDWEEPRQSAMLSWLQRGGTLHLLLDSNRQQLRFSGLLAALNEPFPEFAVGAGTVVRQDIQRNELTEEMVNAVAVRKRMQGEENLTAMSQPGWNYARKLSDDDELFQILAQLVEPKHSWFLIALLCITYVGLLYPGGWWFSRREGNRHYHSIAYVLGTVVFFSVLFIFLGQRGYGESTSFRTLMIALAEDSTHWSCLQFSQVFVTEGADCRIEDDSRQTLLASALTEESVDATIISGNTASFSSRIPPFSREPLVARSQIVLPDWEMKVAGFTVNGTELSSLALQVGRRFPFGKNTRVWMIYRDRIWPAEVDEGSGSIRPGNGRRTIAEFLGQDVDTLGFLPVGTPALKDPDAANLQHLEVQMIRRALSNSRQFYSGDIDIPADRILLLVKTDMPASCNFVVSPEMQQTGQILYLKEVPLAEGQ